MKRPQEKEYFKGWLTSADDAIDKGTAYAKSLNEYIDNLEAKVDELNIQNVDSRRELLIAYDMKVNAVIGSDSDCQRLWSVQTVDEYISNL